MTMQDDPDSIDYEDHEEARAKQKEVLTKQVRKNAVLRERLLGICREAAELGVI